MSGLKTRGPVAILFLILALSFTAPAAAHKARLFALVEGAEIRGYGYFSKSSRAVDCPVKVYGPGNRELGQTATDKQGEFTYPLKYGCDHTLVLEAGEGHEARFLIRADELPDGLEPCPGDSAAPTPSGSAQSQSAQVQPGSAKSGQTAPTPKGEITGNFSAEELDRALSTALARELEPLKKQVTALRRQVDEYEEKIRWHDVLGGIGFILGLAGVALWASGRGRKEKS